MLILTDGLHIQDFGSPSLPALKALAARGAVAMMNCVTPKPRTNSGSVLAMAYGDHLACPDSGVEFANDSESVQNDYGNVREIYARRTGRLAELSTLPGSVRCLSIAYLAQHNLTHALLGPVLNATHISTAVYGNADTAEPDRSAALLTMDATGTAEGDVNMVDPDVHAPFGMVDAVDRVADAVSHSSMQFIVVRLGDMRRLTRDPRFASNQNSLRSAALGRLDRLVGRLSAQLPQTDLIVACSDPPARPAAAVWDSLAPVAAAGPDFPHGALFSATTRTDGLVANLDICPTICHLFGIAPPLTSVGRPFTARTGAQASPLDIAERLDRISNLNAIAVTRVTIAIAVTGIAALMVGFVRRRRLGAASATGFRVVPAFGITFALAALLAPLLNPHSVLIYGIEIGAIMIALTCVEFGLSSVLHADPPLIGIGLFLIVLVFDLLTGQEMLKPAILCGYAPSGIRYYGIGNEYLGIVIAFALAAGYAACRENIGSGRRRLVVAFWVLLALLMGWPGAGANAGSLAVWGAVLPMAVPQLYGRRGKWRWTVLGGLGGIALAAGLGILESKLSHSGGSHIGEAISSASAGRGVGYLGEIALRKIAMDLRLLLSPWLLLAAGLVAAVIVVARSMAGSAVTELVSSRPWIRRLAQPTLAAIGASLLFKDSGVVTVVFMVGAECAVLLYYLFAGQLPSKAVDRG